MEKKILDVTCGDRTIWFQKNEPHTIYCDKRREEWEGDFGKTLRADGKKKPVTLSLILMSNVILHSCRLRMNHSLWLCSILPM